MRSFLCVTVVLILVVGWACIAPRDARADEKTFDGKTVAEWIADFDGSFTERRKAHRALLEVGEAAVPALIQLVESGDKKLGQAMQTLGEMGPVARPALPLLIEIIRDRERKAPEGWTWNVTPRQLALSAVRDMEWAAAELVPVLLGVAADASDDDETARTRAVHALGGLGDRATSALRELTRSESAEIRKNAHLQLAGNAPEGKKEYFALLLEQEPCDVNAADFLMHAKGVVNAGKLDPLTERVKAGMRECLERNPEPELARALAEIISSQLSSTALCWAAPVDGVRSLWARENPKESFHTLREVLEIGFEAAAEGSPARREFGEALARLELLVGDWKAMNRRLAAIGEKPVPQSARPWLAAPPSEWKDLAANWTAADESLRNGTATLVFEMEKDGKPLAGVHVLVKEAPKPQKVFRSGIAADTLFLSPTPFGRLFGGFGYRGADRPRTRYAVSDSSGVVRLEKLPAIPVKLEVLVPTSNFQEEGSEWELLMEVAPGDIKLASNRPSAGAQSSSEPPGLVQLEDGKTTRYPKLIVRARSGLNLNDFASVDADSFTLTWRPPSTATDAGSLRYEVELALSAPADSPGFLPSTPTLATGKEDTTRESWPLGAKGVGEIRLVPGNFYWVRVSAYDGNDALAFRSPQTRFWVPWKHRSGSAPVTEHRGSRDSVPITHGKWWRSSARYSDGTEENLRQMVERFLKTRKSAFEYEYVAVGSAWLDWRDGHPKKAKLALQRLMEPLPPGNVARETAQWLIERLDAGDACPKRLHFTGE